MRINKKYKARISFQLLGFDIYTRRLFSLQIFSVFHKRLYIHSTHNNIYVLLYEF